jgi:5-methylcytosine-specific restriction endonuclease McrA
VNLFVNTHIKIKQDVKLRNDSFCCYCSHKIKKNELAHTLSIKNGTDNYYLHIHPVCLDISNTYISDTSLEEVEEEVYYSDELV